MVVGAFRHGLKLEKAIEIVKPLNGRIKCLKENEYISLNKNMESNCTSEQV